MHKVVFCETRVWPVFMSGSVAVVSTLRQVITGALGELPGRPPAACAVGEVLPALDRSMPLDPAGTPPSATIL